MQEHKNSSKLRDVAGNDFKFVENGRKASKGAENSVGKGEIAYYKPFQLRTKCWKDQVMQTKFNPLPNNKILDQSKLKAFADNKLKLI